jgi:hypothetical protein
MEHIEIKTSDFRVYMSEKNKLYQLYGREYEKELPMIYKKLSDILNSDNFFTKLIERRLRDKHYHENALEELKNYLLIKLRNFDNKENILEDQKKNEYFDVLFSIVELLFNIKVEQLLLVYLGNKEQALSDCFGVEDIEQCEFIIDRYHKFIDSLSVDATPSEPYIDETGHMIIKQGDLYHGTLYSESVIENISNRGLESGQLHGVIEDGETYCCVDFFKAYKDSTPDEICSFGKQYTNGKNQIVFVINNSDLKGPNAMFPDLTEYDAYDDSTEKGKKAREIVNVAGLPLNSKTASAILMGVPPSMISTIIVNSEIENNPNKIDFLSSHFPKVYIVSRQSGIVIKGPNQNYKL